MWYARQREARRCCASTKKEKVRRTICRKGAARSDADAAYRLRRFMERPTRAPQPQERRLISGAACAARCACSMYRLAPPAFHARRQRVADNLNQMERSAA